MMNVHRAAFAALKAATPVNYQTNPATGANEWNLNMTLHQIMESLDAYCQPTNTQIDNNEAVLTSAYNHTTPIYALFRRFEECREIALHSDTRYAVHGGTTSPEVHFSRGANGSVQR